MAAVEGLEPRLLLAGEAQQALGTEAIAFNWAKTPTSVTIGSSQPPSGAMVYYNNSIYQTSDVETINWLGETDTYSLSLEAGHRLVVKAVPAG